MRPYEDQPIIVRLETTLLVRANTREQFLSRRRFVPGALFLPFTVTCGKSGNAFCGQDEILASDLLAFLAVPKVDVPLQSRAA
jgi:hypothetical protein